LRRLTGRPRVIHSAPKSGRGCSSGRDRHRPASAYRWLKERPLKDWPGLIPIWEFTNELAIDQPATFSFRIDLSCFTDRHAFLHHKRVVEIRSPLLMKWRNTKTVAIGDNIANPAAAEMLVKNKVLDRPIDDGFFAWTPAPNSVREADMILLRFFVEPGGWWAGRERIAIAETFLCDAGMPKDLATTWAFVGYAFTVGSSVLGAEFVQDKLESSRKLLMDAQFPSSNFTLKEKS
jgi:hypothetical protein